jgi:hypothetical protein
MPVLLRPKIERICKIQRFSKRSFKESFERYRDVMDRHVIVVRLKFGECTCGYCCVFLVCGCGAP